MPYLLYSLKSMGWLTPSGQYMTDQSFAKRFTREEALIYCRRHKDARGPSLLPILLSDLEAL